MKDRDTVTAVAPGTLAAFSTHARCIEAREPVIGAWAHLDLEGAARQVEQAERIGQGVPDEEREPRLMGALAGVPIGIKDVFDTVDMPTCYGSPIFAGHRPKQDAWIVRRLREAGAAIVGKTESTEFAYLHPARTTHPMDAARTPGGSSSGSAAAVAAGMVPLAIGTQTAGSTIRPAAYCGVFGFKPTFGIVPMTGCRALAPSLDTVGLFAHDLSLLARLAGVLSNGQIAGGPSTQTAPPRVRIAAPTPWGCEDSMHRLFEDLGRRLNAVASCDGAQFIDAEETIALHRLTLSYEAHQEYRGLVQAHGREISEPFHALMKEGASHTGAAYASALQRRREMRAGIDREFAHFDVLLLPSAPGEAPLRSGGSTGNPDCCRLASLLGLPAITVPAGTGPAGLPLGVQLVGRAGGDSRLLEAAGWFTAFLAGEQGRGQRAAR